MPEVKKNIYDRRNTKIIKDSQEVTKAVLEFCTQVFKNYQIVIKVTIIIVNVNR